MNKTYSVYTLASRSRNLYTGVTGNLERRMLEHRQGLVLGFSARFKIFRLVHYESFADVRTAIAREKEIKGWRRQKKIHLIEEANPTWEDFATQLPHKYLPQLAGLKQIPHPVRKKNANGIRDDGVANGASPGRHNGAEP